MITTHLTLADISQMTAQTGEGWAVAHAKRLVELVTQISGDLPYDARQV